jgi:hypothetical protein
VIPSAAFIVSAAKTDIDPVDVGDNIQKHEQRNYPPPQFTEGSYFDITDCDSGFGRH